MINLKHIYYINLNERLLKKEFIENQLSNIRLPHTRVNGIICENFLDYPIESKIKYGSAKHKGTIGCFLAHMKCLEKIYKKYQHIHNNQYFIILEDDTRFDASVLHDIQHLSIPDDWEVLFINSAKQYEWSPNLDPAYCINPNLYKIYDIYPRFLGAFFYVLNISAIEKILKLQDKIIIYEDFDLFVYQQCVCYTYLTKKVSINRKYKSDRDPDHEDNSFKEEG